MTYFTKLKEVVVVVKTLDCESGGVSSTTVKCILYSSLSLYYVAVLRR